MTKKIFIIDDDRDMVESLTMVLSKHGYEVAATHQAAGAVEQARQAKPDLIVLDVMFPENPSAGFELARKLHEDPATGLIPVVVLSAVNTRFSLGFSEKDRDDSWLPVKHFIEKPIVPDKLIAMVGDLIGKSGS